MVSSFVCCQISWRDRNVKFQPVSNSVAAASAANQLSNFIELQISCKSNFEKAANLWYNINTKDEERKSYKKLSEILAAGNLKIPQISAIIYIESKRDVTLNFIKTF